MEQVILVNERDEEIGVEEKLRAHRNGGRLHRAFSIFVFNSAGELLLQRRAATKYHFAGLWSNTCCGHPRPGEGVIEAAERRLEEEFGFRTPLSPKASLIYEAHDAASALTELEFLHILIGRFDDAPAPNPLEIDKWRWANQTQVDVEIKQSPGGFTPWFPIALKILKNASVAY